MNLSQTFLGSAVFDRVPSALTAMRLADKVREQAVYREESIMRIAILESRLPDVKMIQGLQAMLLSDNYKQVTTFLTEDICKEIKLFR